MRVTITTAGTTGTVRPYVALGKGLRAAGYTVRLATHRNFEYLIRTAGLEFLPLAVDPQTVLAGDVGERLVEGRKTALTFARSMLKTGESQIRQVLDDLWDTSQDADLLIYNPLIAPAGRIIGEKRNIPVVFSSFYPVGVTGHIAPVFTPPFPYFGQRIARHYNRSVRVANWSLIHQLFRRPLNEWRVRTLDLQPLPVWRPTRSLPQPILSLYAFSPSVVPKPPDWSDEEIITGYWFLDHEPDWQPPRDLVDFLRAGPPPVYVGFGSMVSQDPGATLALALEALRRTGQRGLLLTGWGGLRAGDLPESVFMAEAVPHDWLFPRMAAVIHHGGAGTTAAGLRAGIPTITVPYLADQPFWGRQLAALGVGPSPLSFKKLTADCLTAAITEVTTNQPMRARAAALGEKIRAEDGVAVAVDALGRVLDRRRGRSVQAVA